MSKTRLPAFLLKHSTFKGVAAEDLELPQLKLLQAHSAELTKFANARQGEFWHGLTDEPLGSAVRICPVYIDSRFVLWNPIEAGGGVLARADDGKHWTPADAEFGVTLKSGRLVTWRTAQTVKASGLDRPGSFDPDDPMSPPAADRMYWIVSAFPDRQDLSPALVILQRAAVKAGTRLVSRLKAIRAPSFGVVLEMRSGGDGTSSGGFYSPVFEVVGPVESRDQYEENFLQYRFFMEHGLRAKNLESAQEQLS